MPRSVVSRAIIILAKAARSRPPPQRDTTRGTSWLENAQDGQAFADARRTDATLSRIWAALKPSRRNTKV